MERTFALETVKKVGQNVILCGWVHARRNMGKIVFLDMRDRSGIVQVVVVPKELDELSQTKVLDIRPEFVLQIEGIVNTRQKANDTLPTGTVEILAKKITILNTSKTPPFEIENEDRQANEELRLKYRYLDLRHERMARNIRLRDQIITFIRSWMHKQDFVEIETPILMKGTPEGSREFIVPSRLHAGKFYVLPQSPQQFKQLLMIAGFERYFQIARCFRDEDQRGDRQPEFTQLDFEMSFVEREDVLSLTERLFIDLVNAVVPEKHVSTTPFPRFTYTEIMEKYGTDKPDLRLNKADPNELAFCWIIDFPMFEKNENGELAAKHHPFCAIHPDDMSLLESNPLKVRANAYDLVLNGFELSSGSIRIHERVLQKKIFDILQISEEEQEERFGHILEAFEYGAPPYGGFAPGIDRVAMIFSGEQNIREVIAFPKTGDASDPMMGAPSELPQKALDEAHIKLKN